MEQWVGKVAVVTGASAGIGESLVRRLAEEGMQVVGIARRVELVEETASKLTEVTGKLFPLKCDIANEQEVIEAFQWILENVGPVALLINNAGTLRTGRLIDLHPQVMKNVIDTNFYGLVTCTRQAVIQMIDAAIDGQIINVNSVSGHRVVDNDGSLNSNVYTSTKYAVTAFTEVMRQELRNQGLKIKVTSLSPGLTLSEIFKVGNLGFLDKPEDYDKIPHLMPDDCADAVMYILGTKPNVQIHELTFKPLGEMI